jgi:ketosteroid isomerase-like protein
MYHAIVERRLRTTLARLSNGDIGYVTRQFGKPVRHEFAGDHALAGRRESKATIDQWYARLHRLFPDLRFEVDRIHITGWPWDTTAVVEWRDFFSLPDGSTGQNLGIFVIVIRWGVLHRLSIHTDTDRIKRYFADFARAGLSEALAAPITG